MQTGCTWSHNPMLSVPPSSHTDETCPKGLLRLSSAAITFSGALLVETGSWNVRNYCYHREMAHRFEFIRKKRG